MVVNIVLVSYLNSNSVTIFLANFEMCEVFKYLKLKSKSYDYPLVKGGQRFVELWGDFYWIKE
jgi:hypothetical protein